MESTVGPDRIVGPEDRSFSLTYIKDDEYCMFSFRSITSGVNCINIHGKGCHLFQGKGPQDFKSK